MTLIKSISGIRGTIGGKTDDNLTPFDIVKFVSAYVEWLRNVSSASTNSPLDRKSTRLNSSHW